MSSGGSLGWRGALKQPVGERPEPSRAALAEPGACALDPDADDQRIALIARVAQAVGGVAAHPTAAPAAPGSWLFARSRATDAAMTARTLRGRAKPPPLATARADLLGGVVLGAPIARLTAIASVKLTVVAAIGADPLHRIRTVAACANGSDRAAPAAGQACRCEPA